MPPEMEHVTSLEGPVEKIEGQLVLRIPLAAGGEALSESARGISELEGEYLKILIPDWLAEQLGIYEGCLVKVNNEGGKFNIRRSGPPFQ